MAEGFLGVPPDEPGGKKLRTLTGFAGPLADKHQEVDSLAHPDGTLVVVGSGLPVALDVNGQLASLLTELGQKLEPGQAVALDAATLAALESITAAVTGTVSVSNLPATQPVSGPLTDAELRAVPLPVSFPADEAGLTDAQLRAAAVPVSGTVAVSNQPSGGATEVTLASVLAELGQKLEAGQAVALDAATLAALESITAAVTGTVAVSNLPSTQVVSAATLPLPDGAATQATLASVLAALALVAVTGPLTDSQLRSTAVPVSGTVSTGQAQPLTDAQLRAGKVGVADDFQGGECLPDQTGAGAVLTFTFTAPRNLIVVHAVGAGQVARADPFGGTPSATQGFRCPDDAPTYMAVVATVVKVFAPSGMVVSVAGSSRA